MKKSARKRAGRADDARLRKIVGIATLAVAAFLTLAFVSYLFTWRADQAAVLSYGWTLLFERGVDVANWMGPLGAVSAHAAFFYGFGVTSFLFVYLLTLTGLAILKRRPLVKLQRQLRWGLLGLMGLSIMLAFAFQMFDFPMGGAYGYLVSTWLERLIGVPGVVLTFALALVWLVVWIFDPSWSEVRSGKLLERVELAPALPSGLARFVTRGDGEDGGAASAKTARKAKRDRSSSADVADKLLTPDLPSSEELLGDDLEIRGLDRAGDTSADELAAAEEAALAAAIERGRDLPADTGELLELDIEPAAKRPRTKRVKAADELELDVRTPEAEPSAPEAADVHAEREPAEPTAEPVQAALDLTGGLAAPAEATAPTAEGPADDAADTAPAVGKRPEQFDINRGAAPRDILRAEEEAEPEELGPYDPRAELSKYRYPEISLLKRYPENENPVTREELHENKRQIIDALLSFGIQIVHISATVGPTITLYELIPAPGVRISKIKNLSDDIALNLSALGIRIIAPIPGRGSIGIEVPNKNRQMVPLRDVLSSDKYREAKMELPIALGKTISNETMVVDLAKMPHLLVAGATGQGKSVGINTIIMSLLYRKHPAEVKLVMVDPKKVELSLYSQLERHFLTYMPGQEESIITENAKVINTLNSLCLEMDERYQLLKDAKVRHVTEYNAKFSERRLAPTEQHRHRYLPYIVMIIDEFADLIMTAGKEVELPIARIAQLARAVGMHLIIATQRPTVKIITGTIKANFPARLAFKVTSGTDSKTILDSPGAEQLVGMGDMLLSMGAEKVRLQCAFVDTPEVNDVLDFIGEQSGLHVPYLLPEYVGEDEEAAGNTVLTPQDADELLREAAHMVVDNHIGSTSMLQRRMQIGYNRAGRMMDQLCALGIVGEARGSKPREVCVRDLLELESMLDLFYGS